MSDSSGFISNLPLATAVPTSAPVVPLAIDPESLTSPGAISLTLPANTTKLQRQFASGPLAQALSAYDPGIAATILNLQQNRLNAGNAPFSTAEATAMANAAGTGEAVTPEPSGGFFQNLASDVTNLATSIPHIPSGLLHEVQQLPNIQADIARAPQTSNPLEFLGQLAKEPGFRMIPGAYIAGTMAPGGPGLVSGALEHPLYTAMDVMPYAEKLAAGTSIVKGANKAAMEAASEARSLGMVPGKPSVPPIRTFLKGVGGEGIQPDVMPIVPGATAPGLMRPGLTPGPIGKAATAVKDALASTTPGKLIANSQSQVVRNVAKLENWASAAFERPPPSTAPESVKLAFQYHQDALDFYKTSGVSLDAEQASALHQAITYRRFDDLPPELQPMGRLSADYLDKSADALVAEGKLGEVAHASGRQRYDVPVAKRLNAARDNFAAHADVITSHYSDPAIAADLSPAGRQALSDFTSAVATDDWATATSSLRSLRSTDRFDPLPYSETISSARFNSFLEARKAPAAYVYRQREIAQKEFINRLPDDAPPEATAAVHANLYATAGFSPEDIADVTGHIPPWRALQDAGETLHYVPDVAPGKAADLGRTPKALDFEPSLGSTKERLLDGGAAVNDPIVAIGSNAMSILQQHYSRFVLDTATKTYATTTAAEMDKYVKALAAGDVLKDPFMNEAAHAQRWIDEAGLVPWDPDAFMTQGIKTYSPPSFKLGEDQLLIPKVVVDTLRDLVHPKQGFMGQMISPLMGTFRTSVLTLSPRKYLNDITSSIIMGFIGLDNPLSMARYQPVIKLLNESPEAQIATRFGTISSEELHGLGATPPRSARGSVESWGEQLHTDKPGVIEATIHQMVGGQTQARLLENFQPGIMEKIKTIGGNIDAYMEDFSNQTAFLEAFDKGLYKGLTRDEAIMSGIESMNNFFGSKWIDSTPLERTVIRNIFPFYSFTRVMMKFVSQLPATHPWRLGILTNLAKAEEIDAGTGLPATWNRLFSLGPMDENGVVKSLDLGGANPFQDLGSYASMIGFLAGGDGDLSAITKNLNPVLSTALKEMGVDPTRGKSDLYPDVYLDPVTGTPAVRSKNPLIELAQNIIPQTQTIADLAGLNDQFKATLRTNPEAAGRSMLSSFGIPLYAKDVNINEARAKSEATRYTASRKVLADALKTGDWDAAKQWPSLLPILQKIAAMPPSQIQALSLQAGGEGSPSAAEAAKAAILPGNMTGK